MMWGSGSVSSDLLDSPPDVADEGRLIAVVREVHTEHAEDLCWMDIDRIFAAAGLSVPDRRVGSRKAMRQNCDRFIEHLCSDGGDWVSYRELEERVRVLLAENEDLHQQLFIAREKVAMYRQCWLEGTD